ncbi:tail assembly chaperone [Fructilactobacillus sp. Tb1]|uniref:tail assembly chaperone n=1 Tax=Fructilactobacillus sp. Tb1 TaxID=3422304 RepID=UPI003D2984BF
MELTINDKKYAFKFGIRFVEELNKIAGLEAKGMKFGMALSTQIPALQGYDPEALAKILFAANITEKPRLSQDEVINYLDSDADLEKLFKDVIAEITKSNATKLVAKKMKLGK